MSELAIQLGIYRRLIGARARSQLQYRGSFAMQLVGQAAGTFLDFFAILFIFNQVPALAGWSVEQVGFLYATAGISFSLCDLFIGHLDLLGRMIRMGEFDSILTRPVGSLLQVLASDFSLRRLGKAAQALGVLVWVLSRIDVPWDPSRIALFALTIAAGTVIYVGVWVAFATITFWSVDSIEVVNAFTYGGSYLNSHPLGVFGGWLRRFLAFVVPLAFVNYFASLYILDKPDPLGYPGWLAFVAPAVAAAVAVASRIAWRFAVRHYRSTGS